MTIVVGNYSECMSSIGPRQRLQHQGGLSQRWEIVYCVCDTGSSASYDPPSELGDTEKDHFVQSDQSALTLKSNQISAD